MKLRTPRILAGRPSTILAPSRILPVPCTTRYGEVPVDDDVLALLPGAAREWAPWFLAGHQDTPAGSVWTVVACPPVDPATGRNPSEGAEPGGDPRAAAVLPSALWACAAMSEGGSSRRSLRSPDGIWLSSWKEGRLEALDGPFAEDAIPAHWTSAAADAEPRPWKEPDAEALRRLADEHPEAQMLSPRERVRRADRSADRASLARTAVVLCLALLAGLAVQAPVWWSARRLAATEARLASVRPGIDRLERLHASIARDVAYVDASAAALRPSASPGPLLEGIARRVPVGVRLRSFQLESPPGEPGWTLRTDARLPDWRGVSALVDSMRLVQGVRDVRVESQQREGEGVHLALLLKGRWP